MEKEEVKAVPGISRSKLIIGSLVIVVLLMIIVLLAMFYLDGRKRFVSKELKLSLEFNTEELEYKRLLLNAADKVYMERFCVVGSDEKFYLALTRIDGTTDLEETIHNLETDENYAFSFTRTDNATFGVGKYNAHLISYVDESGDVPVTVKYYYDEVDEVVITICSDEKHMPLFEKVLDSIKMDNR